MEFLLTWWTLFLGALSPTENPEQERFEIDLSVPITFTGGDYIDIN